MSIADDIKKVGEDIAGSYNMRVSTVGDIIADTHSTLKDFHRERMHMSEELRSELEHYRKEVADTTRKMLNEYDKEHEEMARELRMDLAKVPKMLNEFITNFLKAQNQFQNMLSSYYKNEIQKPVQSMLGTFHTEIKNLATESQKAHQAWVSFARLMSAKRGKQQAPKKMASMQEQICSILQNNPKGMRTGQIAKEMCCSSQSLRSFMQSMKKQGRISKRKNNKYFFKG